MSESVDRLRALPWHEPAIAEAADEIEQLTADNDKLSQLLLDAGNDAIEIERLTARNDHLEKRFGYLEGDWERRNHIIESQAERIAELEADVKYYTDTYDKQKAANEKLLAENEQLSADLYVVFWDCKDKQRLIETQKQYLDNKDSVIKGMNEMIVKLEAKVEQLEGAAKRVCDSWMNGNCDGDLDGNMADLIAASEAEDE